MPLSSSQSQPKKPVIALVGNPNSGKTTLFNSLTGSRQSVGNWPGVTVEKKSGKFSVQKSDFTLVDLPGTYSIDVYNDEISIDERIARDFLINERPDLIINIVDASNLERNLYLTTEILDTQIPTLIVLNMMDIARQREIELDIDMLEQALGCKVIPVVASRTKGIEQLKEAVVNTLAANKQQRFQIEYPAPIEQAIALLEPEIAQNSVHSSVDSRWLTLRLLENDSLALTLAPKQAIDKLDDIKTSLETHLSEEIDIIVANSRYEWLQKLCSTAIHRRNQIGKTLSDKIDSVVLHPVLGLPIFFLIMYLLFFVTVNLGNALVDFFEILAGTLFIDGVAALLETIGSNAFITFLIAEGIGGGVQVVATFIPIITLLFLGLSILEGTGYMARGAFVLDRLMRFIGLPGKSFVPLLIGFGCSVPSILATRTLKHNRDRLLTILLAPFMSCGAKLPVYALFAAVFFSQQSVLTVFVLYLIGIAVAIGTGFVIKTTLLPGETSPFFMELPTYHLPVVRNIAMLTWHRLKDFILGAGRIIVPMVLVLNFLNAVDIQGNIDPEGSEHSLLSIVGRGITPLFSGFGIEENNWPASVGIFTGILAKEATVGTLDALYSRLGDSDNSDNDATDNEADVEDAGFSLYAGVAEAFSVLHENLSELFNSLIDPLGIGDSIEEADEAKSNTKAAMQARFSGKSGAFAYLLFILLYMPCAAAMGAVYRETNGRWAIFVAVWSTGLAYSLATLFYQGTHFLYHPVRSTIWIAIIAALSIGSYCWLKFAGSKHRISVDLHQE